MKLAAFYALIVLCIVCSLSGCATVPPPRAGTVTDEDYDMCDRAGGCVLMPKLKLIELLKHIRDSALEACKDST